MNRIHNPTSKKDASALMNLDMNFMARSRTKDRRERKGISKAKQTVTWRERRSSIEVAVVSGWYLAPKAHTSCMDESGGAHAALIALHCSCLGNLRTSAFSKDGILHVNHCIDETNKLWTLNTCSRR